jgi:hypothetical protein
MGVSGVRCVQSGPVEAAQVIPESKGSALLVAARRILDRMAQLDIVVSSDRADPDPCRRPPSALRVSAPLARGRALLCRVGDPSPLNPVRVEWGSRGESLRIMADKPARPLGFGQSRRATQLHAWQRPGPEAGGVAGSGCSASPPRPALNLTRYSPNLRGDALQ